MDLLSIVIITQNRYVQLQDAIQSCLNSDLPEGTEIIIIDNGSDDQTQALETSADFHGHPIQVFHNETNKGVGYARNQGFELAQSRYVYFMDDDAIIAPLCQPFFFTKALEFLESHKNVATLSTGIYDELLKRHRVPRYATKNTSSPFTVSFVFNGGSHFIRKDDFSSPLYIDIQYGNEEIVPSVLAMDKGQFNAYLPDIEIIHQPQFDKWEKNSEAATNILIQGNAHAYASKALLYPVWLKPLLTLTFLARCTVHLGLNIRHIHTAYRRASDLITQSNVPKIKLRTLYQIYQSFGLKSIL